MSIFNAWKNEYSGQKVCIKKYAFIMRVKRWGKLGKVIFKNSSVYLPLALRF